ncbi:MAG: right-handed parallel beta-helix repeat-containing protein [Patescibacteria group bacterium]|nr:right-handed parallel beta-helix repeat-containing protein [Patescibacteria group bacterium]
MIKKSLFIILLATIFVFAVDINDCAELDAEDTWYDLTTNANLNLGDTICFNVTAENVTLDCNGYFASGTSGGSYGIWSNSSNLTVMNCEIKNFYYGLDMDNVDGDTYYLQILDSNFTGHASMGIRLEDSHNAILNNVNISDTHDGIRLEKSNNSKFYNILIEDDLANCIGVFPSSVLNTFENVTLNHCFYAGVNIAGSNNTFDNLKIYNASTSGITMSGTAISNNFTNINISYSHINGINLDGNGYDNRFVDGYLLGNEDEGLNIAIQENHFENLTISVDDQISSRCILVDGDGDNGFNNTFINGTCYGSDGYGTTNTYMIELLSATGTIISNYNFSYGSGPLSPNPLPAMILVENTNDLNISYSNFSDNDGMTFSGLGQQYFTAIKFMDDATGKINTTNVSIHNNNFENFTKGIFFDLDAVEDQDYVGAINISYNTFEGYPDSSDSYGVHFDVDYSSDSSTTMFTPFNGTILQGNTCQDLGDNRYCFYLDTKGPTASLGGYGMDSSDLFVWGNNYFNSSGFKFEQDADDGTSTYQSTFRDASFGNNQVDCNCTYSLHIDVEDGGTSNTSIYGFHDYQSNYSRCDDDTINVQFDANTMPSYKTNIFENCLIEEENSEGAFIDIDYSWVDFVNTTITDGQINNDNGNATVKWKAWVQALRGDFQPFADWMVNATNKYNVTVLNTTTNSTGYAGLFNLTEYNVTSGGTTQVFSSDHYFNTSAWGAHNDNTTNFYNITENYDYSNPIIIYLAQCPGAIIDDMALTEDLYSDGGNCITTYAPVNINCNNYHLIGVGTTGYGIWHYNDAWVNISNCFIRDFQIGLLVQYATDYSTIYNNTFYSNYWEGLDTHLGTGDYMNISYNNASYNNYRGFYIRHAMTNSNISFNVAHNQGYDGLLFNSNGITENTIINNSFYNNPRQDIYFIGDGSNNYFYNNTLGSSSGLKFGSGQNYFQHNYFENTAEYIDCSGTSFSLNQTTGNYYTNIGEHMYDNDGDGWADAIEGVVGGIPMNGTNAPTSFWDGSCKDEVPAKIGGTPPGFCELLVDITEFSFNTLLWGENTGAVNTEFVLTNNGSVSFTIPIQTRTNSSNFYPVSHGYSTGYMEWSTSPFTYGDGTDYTDSFASISALSPKTSMTIYNGLAMPTGMTGNEFYVDIEVLATCP